MVTPMQSAAADDVHSIEQFLNGIDSGDLVSGFEKMAAEKTNKIKLTLGGKSATRAQRTMTIRLTPELQKKWIPVIDEFSKKKHTSGIEVKRRASGEFATAIKDGHLVFEVKEGGKRKVFASEKVAQNIREGLLVLSKKNGVRKSYDSIVDLKHTDFEKMAKSFLTNMQQANETSGSITSEELTASDTDENASPPTTHAGPAQVIVKTPSKDVTLSSTTKQSKPESQTDAEILKSEEKAIEAQREKEQEKQADQKQLDRQKEKLEVAEEKQEAIKSDTAKAEKEAADSKTVESTVSDANEALNAPETPQATKPSEEETYAPDEIVQ